MTAPTDRDRLDAEVRAYLARLDGTTRASVSLLSGIPADQLDHLGGITDDNPPRIDPPALAAGRTALHRAFTGLGDAIRAATTNPPRVEGQLRRRYRWLRRAHLTACRIGLHGLAWDGQADAYTCACRRIMLRAEETR